MVARLKLFLYGPLAAKDGSLAKNALLLTYGNATAQVVTFLANIFLARLFSVSEFGDFGLYTALLGLLLPISSARMDFAVLLPKSSLKALHLALAGTIFSLLFSIFIWITLLCGFNYFPNISYLSKIALYALPLTINLFLISVFSTQSSWATRSNQYSKLTKANMINNIGSGLAQIFMGMSAIPTGLAWGQLVGRFMAMSYLLESSGPWRKVLPRLLKNTNHLWKTLKTYRKFAALNALPALIELALAYLPTLFFYSVFGAEAAGLYLMANRVINAPLALISNSVRNAILPRLSLERYGRDSVQRVFLLTSKRLLVMALPLLPFLLIGATSFPWLFGENWSEATHYGMALSFPLILKMVTVPLSGYLFCNDNSTFIKSQLIQLAGMLLIMGACAGSALTAKQSMVWIMIGDALLTVVYFFMIYKATGLRLSQILEKGSSPLET